MKLLHCADLHIDSPLLGLARYEGAPVERMRSATRRAVERLVDLAVAENVDVVLVGGDVFDGPWRDAGTGLWWNGQLSRLVDEGIRVFVVHGNHDADSVISRRIRPPDGVHVFGSDGPSTEVLDDLPLAVHGQSYATAATHDDLAAGYPDPVPGLVNVGLLHTSLDGREGHAPYAPCRPGALAARGYDLWALGHVHGREHHQDGPTHLLFPGNTQGRHARETGAKGVSLITTDDTSVRSIHHVEVDAVRWCRVPVDCTEASGVDDVEDRVVDAVIDAWREAGRPAAVRVELVGRPGRGGVGDPSSLRTQLVADLAHRSDGDIWLEKVQDRTQSDVSALSSEAVAAVVGAIDRLEVDEHTLADLAELLRPLQGATAGARARRSVADGAPPLASVATVTDHLPAVREQLLSRLEGRV